MRSKSAIKGIIPAVVTPLTDNYGLQLDNLQNHISVMAEEGCDGIVLLGTTGEGPSLGIEERIAVIKAGVEASDGMAVLAGTGCASLADTEYLTGRAYELGVDATLVIPPFYYKNVSNQGLLQYYRHILNNAVPENSLLFFYHIPPITQVPISFELIDTLLNEYPDRVAGVKDSGGDLAHIRELCNRFPDLIILPGSERYLLECLQFGAAGCISATANVLAPLCVAVYRAYIHNEDAETIQNRLTSARIALERYTPFPSSIKYLLSKRYATYGWNVCPPLVPLQETDQVAIMRDLAETEIVDWLAQ